MWKKKSWDWYATSRCQDIETKSQADTLEKDEKISRENKR